MITYTDKTLKLLSDNNLDKELVKEVINHIFMVKKETILVDCDDSYLKIYNYSYGELTLKSSILFDPSFAVMCLKWVNKTSPSQLNQPPK